jgi:hypothetical protein
MTFLDELAASGALGSWADPILNQLRARRDRARAVLARQAELLSQLEASLVDARIVNAADGAGPSHSWLSEFKEQQSEWQQRQEQYFQQQLATLDALTEQIADLAETIPHNGTSSNSNQSPIPTSAPAPVTTASNWEQAKKRLLEELENSSDETSEKTEASKPAVKSRRDWQQVIAEKDAEINRLRILLEQSAHVAPVALPDAVGLDEGQLNALAFGVLVPMLPPGLKIVGFVGTADDIDISLWRPYFTRRVEHILLGIDHRLQTGHTSWSLEDYTGWNPEQIFRKRLGRPLQNRRKDGMI